MKKIKFISLLVLLISNVGNAQEEDANLILSYPEESEISFFQYPEGTLAKAIYKSRAEATNTYPEQLLESIISATDQDWINYNTLGGAEKASEKKPKSDRVVYLRKMTRTKRNRGTLAIS